MRSVGIFILILVVGCVSGSLLNQRFRQSALLSGPTLNVSLSDPRKFTFAAVGDLHIGRQNTDRFRRILAEAQAGGDAFLVVLGDLVEKGETADIEAYRQALIDSGWADRTLAVIGNHDIFGDGWANYQKYNGPSHYSVTIGNSKFIAIDTADSQVGAEQSQWLEGELTNDAENTFILSHYMPVVPGIQTYLKLSNQDEAMRLMALAQRRGVRAWLGGHYHSFLRGRIGGTDYIVAGGGGGRRMAPIERFFFVQVQVDGANVDYAIRYID